MDNKPANAKHHDNINQAEHDSPIPHEGSPLTDKPIGILPLSRLTDDLITMPLRNPNMTQDELETLAHGLNAVRGTLLTATPSDANEVLAIISCIKASLNAITVKTEHDSVEVIHHLVRQANAG